VLTPDEARLLDRLTLGGSSAAVYAAGGVRRARTRGAGLEFHDYRHYQAGDDPRWIDWTVEARLKQLVVRVSRAQGHVNLHILLDTSESMRLGTPAKLAFARRVAAALAYVAIERRDAAGLSTFAEKMQTYLPPAAGKLQLYRVFQTLGSVSAGGGSQLDRSLERYAAAGRGPGLAVVISDYFVPGCGIRGLEALSHRGLVPAALQVVAREELEPEFATETDLIDVEHADGAAVTVSARGVAAYKERLAEHEATLRGFCAAHGSPWARLQSGDSFDQLLTALEAGGLLGIHG
jgi:uncharacterized protein (DUF58 family)